MTRLSLTVWPPRPSGPRCAPWISSPRQEEAGKEINSWVAEETNNLIDLILDPGCVDESTRLVVANAVYFNGSWTNPFNKSDTEEGKFHCPDGSVVGAQFMSSADDQLIAVHDGFKVLRMQYTISVPRRTMTMPSPPYSMCVLLPDAHDGLWSLVDKVASSSPGFLQEYLPERAVRVGEFRVPNFKRSSGRLLQRQEGSPRSRGPSSVLARS
nr:putative serpin-Z6C [Setaria viridis]